MPLRRPALEPEGRNHRNPHSGLALFARVVFLVIITTPMRGHAQPPAAHVRPETPALGALVARASAQSPSVRALIERLDGSDVVVYVRQRVFTSQLLDGRVSLLSVVGERRYLVIELACNRHEVVQMATLGHELHHALEIAAEPSIVDQRTLARFYARIGKRVNPMGHTQTFETPSAADTGGRVRRELLTSTARSANGS